MAVIEVSDLENARAALLDVNSTIVVVPVYNAFDDTLRCAEALFKHTPESAAILFVDDVGLDDRALKQISVAPQTFTRRVVILHHSSNSGFVGSCNDAFIAAGENDVILVNSDAVVGPQWYERMCAAAASSSLVASVSSLTNHGTILSVPNIDRPSPQLPDHLTPDTAAEVVAQMSAHLLPTIPTAVGHCTLITRKALNAVGGFDVTFGRGYGEEVDFSQRAIRLGFKHICADDVFVFHRGSGSFGLELTSQQKANDAIVNARYPWFENSVKNMIGDLSSPLHTSLSRASVAMRGLWVAIDGRSLGPTLMGTQQVIIETIKSMMEHPMVSRVRVLTNSEIPNYARDRLEGLNIEFINIGGDDEPQLDLFDIAYRPHQVSSPKDIQFLRSIGKWIVANQLDNIAFSNPSYFMNSREWEGYRNGCLLSMSCIDGIAYLSESSQREARSEGLVQVGVAERVVYTGAKFEQIPHSQKPQKLSTSSAPLIFVLGVSYLHKNRMSAIGAVEILRKRGRDIQLVLAGPTPPNGSSLGLEAQEFLARPTLKESVVQLSALSESEKRWLFENSSLMLYPTVVEGFGLVPFEAAQYGLATLSTRQGSLDEVLPVTIPTIETLSVKELADLIEQLLDNKGLRESIVSALVSKSDEFTAERTTNELVELFFEVMKRPPNRVRKVIGANRQNIGWTSRLDTDLRDVVVLPGRFIKLSWKAPRIKKIISPDNSRRQSAIRKLANQIRRMR
jgi:GT2 family glycosyltransferase/glycosyltransferase involved in cell wall biosynthesis